jgi:hypothetical protein
LIVTSVSHPRPDAPGEHVRQLVVAGGGQQLRIDPIGPPKRFVSVQAQPDLDGHECQRDGANDHCESSEKRREHQGENPPQGYGNNMNRR